MEYYNKKIQLDKNVIQDIFKNTGKNTKMLVFGLGYDSKMWFNNNPNTYFIEDKDEYIKINQPDIPSENIFHYTYENINIQKSLKMSDSEIEKYTIPEKLYQLAPFDIILIDGPEGYNVKSPGRLIPCHWTSKYLTTTGSLVYIDDSSRKLERYCVDKYFKNHHQETFKNRLKCTKITINNS